MAWKKLSPDEKDLVSKIKSSFKDETTVKYVKKTGFSASKIFYDKGNGVCPRYWNILFDGVEVEDTWKHKNRRAVSVGSSSHDFLQTELEKNIEGIEIEKELWNKNPNIHAFVDAYIPDSNTPIEIKTTSEQNFDYRESSMVGSSSNVMQLLLYMHLLESELGFLIYENRNSLENLIIPVRMDDENKEKITKTFDWMMRVQEVFERGEKIREFEGKRANSVICKTCEVKNFCENKFPEGTVDLPLLSKVLPK